MKMLGNNTHLLKAFILNQSLGNNYSKFKLLVELLYQLIHKYNLDHILLNPLIRNLLMNLSTYLLGIMLELILYHRNNDLFFKYQIFILLYSLCIQANQKNFLKFSKIFIINLLLDPHQYRKFSMLFLLIKGFKNFIRILQLLLSKFPNYIFLD